MEKGIKVLLAEKMHDPKGVFIPKGIQSDLYAEIFEGVAFLYFKDARVTRHYAQAYLKIHKVNKEEITRYLERQQKIVTYYRNKEGIALTKTQIIDKLKLQLEQLNKNAG